MISLKRCTLSLLGLLAIPAVAAQGAPLTVDEVGLGSHEKVAIKVLGTPFHGKVSAGVLDLGLGQPGFKSEDIVNGFSIDPSHSNDLGDLHYRITAFGANRKTSSESTKKPNLAKLNQRQASTIEKLWTLDYAKALKNDQTAAALQIAIWEVVAGKRFVLEDHRRDDGRDAKHLLAVATKYHGAVDSLEALRGPKKGQEYIIAAPHPLIAGAAISVPDGGPTVLLLGSALLALGCFHRRYAFSAARG